MNFADYIPILLFCSIIAAAIMKLNDKFTIRHAGMLISGLSLILWLVANTAYNKGILPRLYSDIDIHGQDLYDMLSMSEVEKDSIIDFKANSISALTQKQKAIDSVAAVHIDSKSYSLVFNSTYDYSRVLNRVNGNKDPKIETLYKIYVEEDSFYVKDLGYQKQSKDYRLFISENKSNKPNPRRSEGQKPNEKKQPETKSHIMDMG